MTEFRTVHDSRTEQPAEIDTTSSATTVYERRNIRQESRVEEMGGENVTITEWVYEQREYTKEEYTQATSLATQSILEALARIEQTTAEIKETGSGDAAAIAAAIEEGMAL